MTTKIPPKKAKSLKLAKQAKGTLDKIIAMVESNSYCPEIIQQTDSVVGLLKTMRKELLAGHLDTCALNHLPKNKEKTIKELLKIYNLSN